MKPKIAHDFSRLDPRRRCVSLAARGLYDEMVHVAISLRNPAIRFAERIPQAADLARIFSCSEAELHAALAELADFNLVVIAADGAVSLPAFKSVFERSAINTANGVRGGRPRNDGLPPRRRAN